MCVSKDSLFFSNYLTLGIIKSQISYKCIRNQVHRLSDRQVPVQSSGVCYTWRCVQTYSVSLSLSVRCW